MRNTLELGLERSTREGIKQHLLFSPFSLGKSDVYLFATILHKVDIKQGYCTGINLNASYHKSYFVHPNRPPLVLEEAFSFDKVIYTLLSLN